MDNFEQQLGAVLGNPEMMQKIMSMAQALGTSKPEPEPQEMPSPMPDIDIGLIKKISGLAGQSAIDKEQQASPADGSTNWKMPCVPQRWPGLPLPPWAAIFSNRVISCITVIFPKTTGPTTATGCRILASKNHRPRHHVRHRKSLAPPRSASIPNPGNTQRAFSGS